MRTAIFASAAALLLGLTACSTKVERIATAEVRDLSGVWNDTDSRLVSEEMIADVLAKAWVGDFRQSAQRRPAVIVGEIRNLSHEHINTKTFVADVERALVNSNQVDVVATRSERQEVREERKDQDLHASEETKKVMGKEAGADFMLKGEVNSIIDVEGSQQVKFYQVDLTLISLADNRKVWVGQKKIKKFVEKNKLRL